PMPVEPLGDSAPHERPRRDGEAANSTPQSNDGSTSLWGEGSSEDGKAQRHDDRSPHALRRPEGDQGLHARREGAGRGGKAEHNETNDNQALATEAITQRSRRDNACGVGERVGVYRPLQGGQAGAEVAMDGGERSNHHQRI